MASTSEATGIARERASLARALRTKLPEIETAVRSRVGAIRDSSQTADVDDLRGAVSEALDYALQAIERGEREAPPPPPALLADARMAARRGIGLDTVLRRYMAGYTLLGDLLSREVEQGAIPSLLPGRGALLDRLLAAVSEEYLRESRLRRASTEEHRADRVRRLLAAEPIDTAEFSYDFDGWHLALAAEGSAAGEVLRELTAALSCHTMRVRSGRRVWAWISVPRGVDTAELEDRLPPHTAAVVAVGAGEPGEGLGGWRLSHRQAVAAMGVARRQGLSFARYGEVGLLAAVIGDELHAESFRELYLQPLTAERDGGATLRETLRAYIAAEQNVSSAAAALGVSRPTVRSRLQAVEERLGRELRDCIQELDVALKLEELQGRRH